MNCKQTAELLGVSHNTLSMLIRQGYVLAERTGGVKLVDPDQAKAGLIRWNTEKQARRKVPSVGEIARRIREELMPDWPAGQQIPTLVQISAQLCVSANHVARAIRSLCEQGVLASNGVIGQGRRYLVPSCGTCDNEERCNAHVDNERCGQELDGWQPKEASDSENAPALAATVTSIVNDLARMAKPNGVIKDKEFIREYVRRYMPKILADYIRQSSPEQIALLIARGITKAELRELMEQQLQSTMDPRDDAWWRLRVCILALKGVDA